MTRDLERFNRAFHKASIDQVWESRRAIIGPANMPPGEQSELAKAALAALNNGKSPTPKQFAALELIVRLMRPSLLSTNRVLEDLPPEATNFSGWDDFQSTVKPSLCTVGRVDNAEGNGIGTGFLVSDKLLITNTHVVDKLSNGTRMLERGQASVRFKREYGTRDDEDPVGIVKVVAVHESLDLSLLEVDPIELGPDRKILSLGTEDAVDGDSVVVLGYPQNDSARNPLFVTSIFGNRFGVKRAAPGEVINVKSNGVFHDCSTLGGNSGSPVVSLKTCRVVAVHSSGEFMYRNESVAGSGLRPFVQANL
jgi:V8-like Glu-specific endopeptidase